MTLDKSKIAVAQLAFCMGMNQTSLSLTVTVAALAGRQIAMPYADLATLPLACMFVGMLATTVPASLVMARWGRRIGFGIGAGCGIVSGLTSATAIYLQSLGLLCAGLGLYGVAAGFANYYRFAASEVASPAFRSKAISFVLAGGCVAGVLGPFLALQGKDLVEEHVYMGSFIIVAALSVLIFPSLLTAKMPTHQSQIAAASGGPPPRSLGEIMRQPKFLVAIFGAMIGYGAMNLIMVSAPLAMAGCGFEFADSAHAIQYHVLGMYVPSFFTGSLIKRFGVQRIMAIGAVITMGAGVVNLSGEELWNFWLGLILLGVGWNFLFVGGTTLLTETYRPSERAKAQAANEFAVFGTVAISALSSGAVYNRGGWAVLNYGILAPLLVVLVTLLLAGRRRTVPA